MKYVELVGLAKMAIRKRAASDPNVLHHVEYTDVLSELYANHNVPLLLEKNQGDNKGSLVATLKRCVFQCYMRALGYHPKRVITEDGRRTQRWEKVVGYLPNNALPDEGTSWRYEDEEENLNKTVRLLGGLSRDDDWAYVRLTLLGYKQVDICSILGVNRHKIETLRRRLRYRASNFIE